MDGLRRQVLRVQRRLTAQRFLTALIWALLATLALAAVAIAVPKLVYVEAARHDWAWWSLAAASVAAVLAASLWAWATRADPLSAAIELDLQFGLKERISSSLSLSSSERMSQAGQALIRDACRAVERIDVPDRFGVSFGPRAWLPLVPATLAFCLALFVDDKGETTPALATTTPARTQIKKSTDALSRKLAKRRRRAEQAGLKDARDLFDKLEQGTRDLARDDHVDKKRALAKLNDLAEQLQQRRKKIGGSEAIRQQLKQMKKLTPGPADRLAQALKAGQFQQALQELKRLRKQLANGKLDDEKSRQLAAQLKQMQERLERMAAAHKEAMEKLEKQIAESRRQGNTAKASKLQQMLDKLAAQAPQMDQMQRLAEKLGECSECMAAGKSQGALAALDDLAQQLSELDQSLAELDMLDDALDAIAECKGSMNCSFCNGQGCSACQGPGNGLGEGRGQGARPEAETDTNAYNSRVRQKPGAGRAVITDLVDGPNAKGRVLEEIEAELQRGTARAAEALTDRRLPKAQREHAEEFFNSFREGRSATDRPGG
ncbi:MAG: hypothetical protein ACC645_07065 [Pirellulales bacterium]